MHWWCLSICWLRITIVFNLIMLVKKVGLADLLVGLAVSWWLPARGLVLKKSICLALYIQYIKYLLKQPISIFGGKFAPKSHTCFPSETKFFWVQLCPLQWPFDITWSHINIYHHVELFDFIILFVLFVHMLGYNFARFS